MNACRIISKSDSVVIFVAFQFFKADDFFGFLRVSISSNTYPSIFSRSLVGQIFQKLF